MPQIVPGGKKKREDRVEAIFILSEALPVVPVCRILKAEYVDIDNIEAERRRMQADMGPGLGTVRHGLPPAGQVV